MAKENIIQSDFKEEVSSAYGAYSAIATTGRGIPSVTDGLKPVQRRVLYWMATNKARSTDPFMKSARVGASVIGTLHPHSTPYDVIVNMGVPFSSLPLIEPRGSFGVAYKEVPASDRYTECRLSEAGMLITDGITDGVVPMMDNYDNTMLEPQYLAPRFPNVLINGTDGVGVAYACKIADHNPTEIMDLAIDMAQRKNPHNITVEEMLEIVPGPDFAVGARSVGIDGIKDYYTTGTGKFHLIGEARIEPGARGRNTIVITSLPKVGISEFQEAVKKKIIRGELDGIAEMKNLTDKNGFRIDIEVKRGVDPETMLKILYAKTPLQVTYAVNMTLISEDGTPRVFSVVDVMVRFLESRKAAIVQKSRASLERKEKRKTGIEGLLAVIVDIDKAISIIRESKDQQSAEKQLMEAFSISEEQAKYVLSLQLRQLTKSDSVALEKEHKKLSAEVKKLSKIIGGGKALSDVLIAELKETRDIISRPRLTPPSTTTYDDHTATIKETVNNVTPKTRGKNKQQGTTTPKTNMPEHITLDPALGVAASPSGTPTTNGVWALYPDGTASKINASTITTTPSWDVLDEKSTSIGEFTDITTGDGHALTVDTEGKVKITDMSTLPTTRADSDIHPDRSFITVQNPAGKTHVLFVTDAGKALKVRLDSIRPQGRSGRGVAGINLGESKLVAAFAVSDDDAVYTLTNDSWKVTPVSDIPEKGRGGGGVVVHLFRKADTGVVEARVASEQELASVSARGKSGVRL